MSLSGLPSSYSINWSLTSSYFYVSSYIPGALAIYPYIVYTAGFFPFLTWSVLLLWLIEVLLGNWTINNTVTYVTVLIIMALVPLAYLQTLFFNIVLIPLVWISPFTLSLFVIIYTVAYYIAIAGY